jgi:DNA-binding transcriptional MerR regulator
MDLSASANLAGSWDGSQVGGQSPPGRPIPPKLYRIGEVVEYAGVSRQTIHNYTAMGLLRESRWTRGGHRLYDESVFERLNLIARMRAMERSLGEIREHLASLEAQGPQQSAVS